VARPSKLTDEFIDQAEKIALLGATDVEIAEILGVTERTLTNWKKKSKEFREALSRGKYLADANVADALYHRAIGYKATDTKFATFEGAITDEREYTKHYPPDAMACMYWLNNRQRKLFQKNPEMEKGADEPIPTKVVFEVVDGRKKD
jgi:transcriptional regulator with XRE-family HTH domain